MSRIGSATVMYFKNPLRCPVYRQIRNSEVLARKNPTKNAPKNDELASLRQHHFSGQRSIFFFKYFYKFLQAS